MSQTVGFDIPQGMRPKTVAEAFNVYLRGHEVFLGVYPPVAADEFIYGPFEKVRHDETNWQLDCSNDFWLHVFTASRAAISCRYPAQVPIIEAMVQLFKACYSPNTAVSSE